MMQALITGDVATFRKLFSQTVINSMSYFDVSGKQPERFYHAFVLGMLVHLMQQYRVKSNQESGLGRYDVVLIPFDTSKVGVIIEFKACDIFYQETLEEAAASALKQIETKQYASELITLGITKITKLAIAFHGKQVLVLEG